MGKEKAEGSRLHVKVRLPRGSASSASADMNRAFTAQVEILMARR